MKVPTLSGTSYPTAEQLRDVNPDFLYGSYRSAFASSLGYPRWLGRNCTMNFPRGPYCRLELHRANVATFLQEAACEDSNLRPKFTNIDTLFSEIRRIGIIFDVQDKAEAVIDEIDDDFATAIQLQNSVGDDLENEAKVFWLDSFTNRLSTCTRQAKKKKKKKKS